MKIGFGSKYFMPGNGNIEIMRHRFYPPFKSVTTQIIYIEDMIRPNAVQEQNDIIMGIIVDNSGNETMISQDAFGMILLQSVLMIGQQNQRGLRIFAGGRTTEDIQLKSI